MADLKFWRKLEKKFRKVDPSGKLGISWAYSMESQRFYFGMPYEAPDERIAVEFNLLASLAGRELPLVTLEPRDAWLRAIRLNSPSHSTRQEMQIDPETGREGRFNMGKIDNIAERSAILCVRLQTQVVVEEARPKANIFEHRSRSERVERSTLRDRYFAAFTEKIRVLDVCWAAGERYREWKRWLQKPSPIKEGSKPDLAFRAVLTSGKRPLEYRPVERPCNWQ